MLNLVTQETASSDAFNQRLNQAVLLHLEGVDGDAAAVQEANRLLQQLRVDYPGHPLVDAYYGSTLILIARDKTKQLEKLKWSFNGLKFLDKAVADDPKDGMIRLLRGKNAYHLPEKHFHRTQTVIEDYTFLLSQQKAEGNMLGADDYAQITYELGEAYARIGRNQDAITSWRRLDSQTVKPELQQLYKQRQRALEGKPAIETVIEESPTSLLLEATRSVGNALVDWSGEGIKKGRKERQKQKLKEIERLKEVEKAKAKQKKNEKHKPKEKEKEKETPKAKKKEARPTQIKIVKVKR
ncbi:hypothetical protein RB620_19850 [Paenibacillus sp. LHD-117]|uniref:hypothetical protein n=1 Tax=Paenibacillus sp. LHD-117 TaxID=3071412 RepID=UPI0027E0CF6A|nr:hypothetical protein [Paenibacillus sp. LHD-117]MDQ6421684.1 hypothetical protein [Paenibacillus sp. LHD-117]